MCQPYQLAPTKKKNLLSNWLFEVSSIACQNVPKEYVMHATVCCLPSTMGSLFCSLKLHGTRYKTTNTITKHWSNLKIPMTPLSSPSWASYVCLWGIFWRIVTLKYISAQYILHKIACISPSGLADITTCNIYHHYMAEMTAHRHPSQYICVQLALGE